MRHIVGFLIAVSIFYGLSYLGHVDPYGNIYWWTLPTVLVGVISLFVTALTFFLL